MTDIQPKFQRVVVTGSAGFIGQWVCERLVANGFKVLGIDTREANADVSWDHHEIDLLDRPRLAQAFHDFQPDAVIHLAARTDLIGETVEDYEVNRGGVRNLCDVVAETQSVRRAVYTSSQLVCRVGYVPKADDDYAATTIYGQSKIATEQIVRETSISRVTWCLTRPTTVWGPGMSAHYTMVPKMIDKGMFFHSGSGALYKSYSYAENIAHQYMQLLCAPDEAVNGEVFYLADYEPFSLRDYVNELAKEMGKRRPPTVPLPIARLLGKVGDGLSALGVPFPYTTFRLNNIRTEYMFDLSKTEAVCGPVPVSFQDGVRQTVSWYQMNKDAENGGHR